MTRSILYPFALGKALGHPSGASPAPLSSREEQCAVTCDQLRGTPAPSPAHSPHDRWRCAVQVERYTSRSNDPCPLSFPDGRCVYLFGESNGDVCAGRGGSGVALSVHSDLQRPTPPALTDTTGVRQRVRQISPAGGREAREEAEHREPAQHISTHGGVRPRRAAAIPCTADLTDDGPQPRHAPRGHQPVCRAAR